MQNTGITVPPVPPPNIFGVDVLGGIIVLLVVSVLSIGAWVYKKGFPEIDKGQTRIPQLGVIVLAITAVLSPEAISIFSDSEGTTGIYIAAMWLNILGIILAGYQFNMSFFLFAIPITLFRLIFPLTMYRYYRGMTSRKWVLLAGVLVEIPMLIFGLPLMILLVVGLAILGIVPVPQHREESVF